MKKRIDALILSLVVLLAVLAGCAGESSSGGEDSIDSGSTGADGQTIRVGFAIKTLNNPFFVKLADETKAYCEELGWECIILDANNKITKEAENMESFITQQMDLIFMCSIDPETCIPSINQAVDAGIPVICLDDAPGEGAKDITTVYSDNLQNGRLVGIAYAVEIGDAPIKAVLISGTKGNISGEERRTGLFCGILEERLGISEEEAWELAEQFNSTLISSGKAEHAEANFTVAGQGWGNWTEEDGLKASEDLITANPDLTLVMGENDQMIFGTITALQNANIENVDLIAAADGAQRGYDYIKEDIIFAIGENSPIMVARKGVDIAKQILVDGVDPGTYPKITVTQAVAVTKDNVDERYEYGA